MQVPNLCEGAPSPTFLVSPLRHRETRSLLEEPLEVEPVGKAVDPVIGGEILFVHAEAVAAFFVHVEFARLFRTKLNLSAALMRKSVYFWLIAADIR